MDKDTRFPDESCRTGGLVNAGVCLAVLLLLFSIPGYGSTTANIQHQIPAALEADTDNELVFRMPDADPAEIEDAYLVFRSAGEVSYQRQQARLEGTEFSVLLNPGSEAGVTVEYYFEVIFNDGRRQQYPQALESAGPVRVEVVEKREENQPEIPVEYNILSPEPGTVVLSTDVLVALSLFYDPAELNLDESSFRLYFDDADVTARAEATPFLFTFAPPSVQPGEHRVTLYLLQDGVRSEVVSWLFEVTDRTTAVGSSGPGTTFSSAIPWMPSGQMELQARNQVLAGGSNDIMSGNMQFRGEYGSLRYSGTGLITSRENPRLQPQNRYGLELYAGNWFEAQAGHIYPVISNLTIAGQRVQGIHTGIHMFNRAISLRLLYGRIKRQVSNLYLPLERQTRFFNGNPVDTSYVLNFQDGGFGTFERNIMGGRLGFGRGETFEMGFNLLKVQDDKNSILNINSFSDLMNGHPEMAADLTPEDLQRLEEDPNRFSVLGNPRPMDNLVAGTDLKINMDDGRIRLQADAGASLLNEDITAGPLTTERAEDLGFDIGSKAEHLFEQLSWLIIINENMNALPLRFGEGGDNEVEPYFPTGILATQSEASFHYLDNNLRLQYRWVGPHFHSMANSTIRKDIAGYSLSDRMSLFGSRLFLTLGYENLHDNVNHTRSATTETVTMRSNISWYPINSSLPRISAGYMNRSRDNGVALYNPFLSRDLETAALINYELVNGSPVTAARPRLINMDQYSFSISKQFELLEINHDASINYSLLNSDDRWFRFGDSRNRSWSLQVRNRFANRSLDTRFGFSYNSTESAGGLSRIDISGINVGGTLYLLDNRLNVDGSLAFTRNHTESGTLEVHDNNTPNNSSDNYYVEADGSRRTVDSNSFIINLGTRYDLGGGHAFLVDLRYNNVSNPVDGFNPGNDRILQARYTFSF